MSAILAFVKKNGVMFYTDGASYGEYGSLGCVSQKAEVMLHMPCIMATRGSCQFGNSLRFVRDTFQLSGFDDLVDALPRFLRIATDAAPQFGHEINLSVLLGGWSRRSESWELYRGFVGGEAPDQLDERSFEVIKITAGYLLEPEPPHELLTARGLLGDDGLDLRDGDAAIIRYMECQRETKFKFGRGGHRGEGCVVGCFVQKTTLTQDEATTAIIHEWPDEVGKLLGYGY